VNGDLDAVFFMAIVVVCVLVLAWSRSQHD